MDWAIILLSCVVVIGIPTAFFLYHIRKIDSIVWVGENRLNVSKIGIDYYPFDQIKKINMVVTAGVSGFDFPVGILIVTFKIELKNGKVFLVNRSENNKDGKYEDKVPTITVTSIKEMINQNPEIEIDDLTQDYLKNGVPNKLSKVFAT